MASSTEAAEFFAELNKQMAKLAGRVDSLFESEGCSSYVKTIYVGYDIGGEMVAALYGRSDHLEIALAVEESHPSEFLIDASHLTWRTLPLAAVVRTEADAKVVGPLIREACARIKSGQHSVNRDNDFFMRSRRERKGR
jgi:hypothetical protein